MPAGIYINIPFVRKLSFHLNSGTEVWKKNLGRKYLKALLEELQLFCQTCDSRPISADTIYFGGGSPTLYRASDLEKILSALGQNFAVSSDSEITLETDPASVSLSILEDLKSIGFNRIVLKVGSFGKKELETLKCTHTEKDSLKTFQNLRKAGFDNIDIDLLFGIPGQTFLLWQESLKKAVFLAPEHISIYSTEISKHSHTFKFLKSKKSKRPRNINEFYLWGIKFLEESGFRQYEISHFAREGKECRHNLKYWNDQFYLGFGTCAHSYIENKRWGNVCSSKDYFDKLKQKTWPRAFEEDLSQKQRMIEEIFSNLRQTKGIDLKKFQVQFGYSLEELKRKKIEKLISKNLVWLENSYLGLTKKGMIYCEEIVGELI